LLSEVKDESLREEIESELKNTNSRFPEPFHIDADAPAFIAVRIPSADVISKNPVFPLDII